jgi:hypothetical protein
MKEYKLVLSIFMIVVLICMVGCDKKDDDELSKTAASTEYVAEFYKCCSQITDQVLIAKIVLTGDSWARRRTALDFITNKDLLSKISSDSKDFDVQEFASERLKTFESGQSLDEVNVIKWFFMDRTGKVAFAIDVPKAKWQECIASIEKKAN